MAVNYNVLANVIDIRQDAPRPDDIFLVDTNVWYWLTYTRASQADYPPRSYQINDYPTYVAKALSTKSQLHRCGLSLAELAHRIEKTELEIYSRITGFNKKKRRNSVIIITYNELMLLQKFRLPGARLRQWHRRWRFK